VVVGPASGRVKRGNAVEIEDEIFPVAHRGRVMLVAGQPHCKRREEGEMLRNRGALLGGGRGCGPLPVPRCHPPPPSPRKVWELLSSFPGSGVGAPRGQSLSRWQGGKSGVGGGGRGFRGVPHHPRVGSGLHPRPYDPPRPLCVEHRLRRGRRCGRGGMPTGWVSASHSRVGRHTHRCLSVPPPACSSECGVGLAPTRGVAGGGGCAGRRCAVFWMRRSHLSPVPTFAPSSRSLPRSREVFPSP